jgi:hypothetical protein
MSMTGSAMLSRRGKRSTLETVGDGQRKQTIEEAHTAPTKRKRILLLDRLVDEKVV